jgi:hypothetical protein
MSTQEPLVERAVMGFDIEGFSGLNTRRQGDAQAAMDGMVSSAATKAGLNYSAFVVETTGDGALMVLPADVDMVVPIARFIPELEIQLSAYNDDRNPETRMRWRVAMHTDAIRLSPPGGHHSGPALVVLSRLLDSAPVRRALKDHPSAHLALIVSEPVYRKVCLSGLGGIRPEHYTSVEVDLPAKNFREPAYLYVPGHVPGHGPERDPGGGPPRDAAPADSSGSGRRGAGLVVEGDVGVLYQDNVIQATEFTGRDGHRGTKS